MRAPRSSRSWRWSSRWRQRGSRWARVARRVRSDADRRRGSASPGPKRQATKKSTPIATTAMSATSTALESPCAASSGARAGAGTARRRAACRSARRTRRRRGGRRGRDSWRRRAGTAHVRARRKAVELLLLERAEVFGANLDLRLDLLIGQLAAFTRLAQSGTDLEHESLRRATEARAAPSLARDPRGVAPWRRAVDSRARTVSHAKPPEQEDDEDAVEDRAPRRSRSSEPANAIHGRHTCADGAEDGPKRQPRMIATTSRQHHERARDVDREQRAETLSRGLRASRATGSVRLAQAALFTPRRGRELSLRAGPRRR